jgi:acyl carrier protein
MQNEYAERDLQTIKEIICKLLSLESIGEDEDMYQAGLTSIMVLPLLAEVEATFQLTIPDDDFLDARTPQALAQMIQRLRNV